MTLSGLKKLAKNTSSIILCLLMAVISFSCGKKSADPSLQENGSDNGFPGMNKVNAVVPENKKPVEEIKSDDNKPTREIECKEKPAIPKGDTVITSESPKNIQPHKNVNQEAIKVTVSPVQAANKKGESERALKAKGEMVNNKEMAKCYSLNGIPVTGKDALDCAMFHWREAIALMTSNTDSAYAHCRKSMTLYENGSNFALRAQLMMKYQKYAEAIQAAEGSIARNDHWDPNDRIVAYRVRYLAYDALYRKYPSSEGLKKANKAKEDMEIMIRGGNK